MQISIIFALAKFNLKDNNGIKNHRKYNACMYTSVYHRNIKKTSKNIGAANFAKTSVIFNIFGQIVHEYRSRLFVMQTCTVLSRHFGSEKM